MLLATAPPGRVLYASDPPYGTAGMGLQITARMARACGWGDSAMRALMGGNARRIFERADLSGDERADGAEALPGAHHMPVEVPAFRRAAEYLATSVQIDFTGGDAAETYDLAQSALAIPADHEHSDRAELLAGAMRVGQAIIDRDNSDAIAVPGEPEPGPRAPSALRRVGIELLVCTLTHLATPGLPSPGVERTRWDA